MKKLHFLRGVLCWSLFCTVVAVTGAIAEEIQCPECPECPSCETTKDLSNWQLSTSLGFNLTRGNSDTLLLNSVSKADREINNHIYSFSLDGSYGRDENLDDEENGSTSQKKLLVEASYKHLLSERLFAGLGAKAYFDQIADIDYRYILNPSLGYFLIKNDAVKFSLEAGPSFVAEKQGGVKNEYLGARFAEELKVRLSDTATAFQKAEILISFEDGDDTLTAVEAGIEAAINSSMALVLTVKDVYDNQPASDKERNDLTVIAGLQVNY